MNNLKLEFENWVKNFSDEMFSWAFYKTSSKEIAEDLVQETFMAAYQKIESFEGKSKPKTWLFSILNNKIVDYYRLSARTIKKTFTINEQSSYDLTDGLFNEDGEWRNQNINPIWDDETELLDNSDFNKTLDSCIDDLPAKWKTAIISKYLTDKNTDTICQELEITLSNYWQIIHRSKLFLKKCLETKWLA